MRHIRVREYRCLHGQPLSAPVAQALRDCFAEYIRIERNFEGNAFDIQARDWVGQIVIGDTAIVIEPKTPLDNLFYMLTYAYNLPVFRRQPYPLGLTDDLLETMVLLFARQLEQLVRQGIYRGYVVWEENQTFMRGRLLVREQLRHNTVQLHRFFTRRDEFTADVLENQLLKAVLFRLSRLNYQNTGLGRRVQRLLSAFNEVSLSPITHEHFQKVRYGRLNQHYEPLHNLSYLLWKHLSLESRGGDQAFVSYLVHMWLVFEVFVTEYLVEYFSSVPGIDVSVQQNIWLDLDQRIQGRPDIVIKVDNRPVLVLDTKYKLYQKTPDQNDLYQLQAYCLGLAVRRGILIYPGDVLPDTIVFTPGVTIDVRSLDLSGDLSDFQARCQAFAAAVEKIAEGERHELAQPA